MKSFFIAILLSFVTISYGQIQYQEVDSFAKEVPKSVRNNIPKLAQYLTSSFENQELKYRAIFSYLHYNIEYNNFYYLYSQKFKPDILPEEEATFSFKLGYQIWKFKRWITNRDLSKYQSAKYVLKHKTAVCSGYATLFKELCDAADLPSWEVIGYVKGYLYQPGDPFFRTNHVWNGIETEEGYALVDPTWNKWISTPDSFLMTHLPMDPMWQLKEYPISIQQFEKDSTGFRKPWDKKGADTLSPIYNGKYPLAYKDSIDSWRQLEEYEQDYVSTFRSHLYNPKNHSDIGYAWYGLARVYSDRKLVRKIDPSIEFSQFAKNKALECANQAEFHLKECKKVEIPSMYNVQKNRYKSEYKDLKAAIKQYKSELKAEIKTFKSEYKEDKKLAKQDMKDLIEDEKRFYDEMIEELEEELESDQIGDKSEIKFEIRELKQEKKESIALLKMDKRYETSKAKAKSDGFREYSSELYEEESARLEKVKEKAKQRKDKLLEHEQERKQQQTKEIEELLRSLKSIKRKL